MVAARSDARDPRGALVEDPQPRPFAPQEIVIPRRSAWHEEYPFASRWLDVSGGAGEPLWMHVVDEGPLDAPVVVMLHGNPTWSFYWRKLVVALRDRYRCIVPDHIGMGLSDRPQQWPYRLADHVKNVETLLDALGVKRFSLCVHDWGGAIGFGVATERPDAVEKLVVTNTAAFRSTDIPASIASVRIPVFGRVAVLRFNAFAFAATIRAVEHKLSDGAKAGLLAPYGNPHDRLATLRFVEDIPMKPAHPSYARLLRVEERLASLSAKPMMLLWGDADFCFTPKFRATWQAHFPNAAVHAWNDVGHYVMEDAPDRVIPLVERFLAG